MNNEVTYFYSNGVANIQLVEDVYVEVEFHPNNQTTESFEKAEFDNTFKVETILDGSYKKKMLHKPSDVEGTELTELYECIDYFMQMLTLQKHIDRIIAVELDGVYWEVDYCNRADETDNNRANLVCFNREEVYISDEPKLETKRIYLDEIKDMSKVYVAVPLVNTLVKKGN